MRTPFLYPILAASLLSLAACGDDPNQGPLRCGAGEEIVNGECVRLRGDARTTDADEPDAPDILEDTTIPDTTPPLDTSECIEGQLNCADLQTPIECISGEWIEQPACTGSTLCTAGRCVDGSDCEPGQVLGCFDDTSRYVCNAEGTTYVSETCDDGLFCFRGECGTQICEPDQLSCGADGRYIFTCAPSGEELIRTDECDPRENLACVGGECVSGCAAALKDPTYIGCEYWSADLPQYRDPFSDARGTPHAVVIANTGTRAADIEVATLSGIALVDERMTVGPGEVATINFPVANVEETTRSRNSFRISTSEPVVAYQFNPLNNANVASNDASLLLPANAIGREYYVLSWPSGVDPSEGPVPLPGVEGAQNGWFTVIAARPGTTEVTITFSADVYDGTDTELQGITAGTTRTFQMEQYDVLNFEGKTVFSFGSEPADLTGSHVVSDRAVVVFGGHSQAVLGQEEAGSTGTPCCADHLEEQLFPVSTWGTRYPAVHSPPRGTEPDVWRVIAARDNTRITTVPPISGLDGITLNAGEWAEAEVVESFEIVGSQPILVAHYLVSQQDHRIPQTKGDPSMILAVAAEQFRTDYSILVPESYAEDWITVIRPAGAVIELDGTAIPDSAFTAFGSNVLEYAHVAVEPGPHTLVTANEADAFGIAAYGYNSAVSYGYPGGLNLATELGTP